MAAKHWPGRGVRGRALENNGSEELTDDLDIFRAAKLLIDRHGDEAALYAAGRADLLLEDGDTDGVAIWRRITSAVEEIQRERRPDKAVN